MVTENTTIEELFGLAVNSLKDVQSEEKFLVKDLFRGFEWNRIKVGNRTKLGSMFLNYAKAQPNIDVLGKTLQNQQIYKVI